MGKRSRGSHMSGVAHILKSLGDFQPVAANASIDSTSAVEELVQSIVAEAEDLETPPSKKAKPTTESAKWDILDVSTLVQHYDTIDDAPEHLKKYFAQRHRYFSRYDMGCLLDEEGWYSVTPEKIADQIAERCRCGIVLDAFCGVGGNAIAFANTCEKVIALDISPSRLALARHNASIYGVADRIEFILVDYLEYAKEYASKPEEERNIDVVFLSPPWGGPQYLTMSPSKEKDLDETMLETAPSYSLRNILPISGDELFRISRRVSNNVAYYLPRNVDLDEVSRLLAPNDPKLTITQREEREEMVEVEEEYMAGKLKAVTCYFGGLVLGQEDMF